MWAAPYFPMRAVGIPIISSAELIYRLTCALHLRTPLATRNAVLGGLATCVTLWLCWGYSGMLFSDFLDPHASRRLSTDLVQVRSTGLMHGVERTLPDGIPLNRTTDPCRDSGRSVIGGRQFLQSVGVAGAIL
jgi:hypothetical protein